MAWENWQAMSRACNGSSYFALKDLRYELKDQKNWKYGNFFPGTLTMVKKGDLNGFNTAMFNKHIRKYINYFRPLNLCFCLEKIKHC